MRFVIAFLISTAIAVTAAEGVPLTVSIGSKPALKLTLPVGWKSTAKGDVTTLLPPQGAPHIQLWPVAEATSVSDVVAKIPAIIVGEVKDFTATSTRELTIAGAPAAQVDGTGTEADDGDPSNAEVTVLSLGGTIYLLVAHGEGDGVTKRHDDVLATLASIAAP